MYSNLCLGLREKVLVIALVVGLLCAELEGAKSFRHSVAECFETFVALSILFPKNPPFLT